MPYLDQAWLEKVAKHSGDHEKTLLDDLLTLRKLIADARAEGYPPIEELYQEAAPAFRKKWRTLQNMVLVLREYTEKDLKHWIIEKKLPFEGLHMVNKYSSWGLLPESPATFLSHFLADPKTVDEIEGAIISVQGITPREFLDRSYAFRLARKLDIPPERHEEFVKQILELIKCFRDPIDGFDLSE